MKESFRSVAVKLNIPSSVLEKFACSKTDLVDVDQKYFSGRRKKIGTVPQK
jgi:hypothetical protein